MNTKSANSFESNPARPSVFAPNIFLIPISFILVRTIKDTRPSNPMTAMINVITANTINTVINLSSALY